MKTLNIAIEGFPDIKMNEHRHFGDLVESRCVSFSDIDLRSHFCVCDTENPVLLGLSAFYCVLFPLPQKRCTFSQANICVCVRHLFPAAREVSECFYSYWRLVALPFGLKLRRKSRILAIINNGNPINERFIIESLL